MKIKKTAILIFNVIAFVIMSSAVAQAKSSTVPIHLQGTWVVDISASETYMAKHEKTELIEALPFMESNYKYVLDENTMTTFRKETEIGRTDIVEVTELSDGTTLTVSGINPSTNEAVEFEINFVSQANNLYVIKLSISPANDYFVWKKNPIK